jgi:signal transduction histidine kinase
VTAEDVTGDPAGTRRSSAAGRDTGVVSDPPTDERDVPFSVRGALGWWFGPLLRRSSWDALWYVAVGVPWSIVMLVATAVTMVLTFGLTFVVVGLFLVVPTFALVDSMVSVERRRAEWIGRRIAPRPRRTVGDGARWWRSIASAVTDPERWRQVGFVVAYAVVAPVLFALALAAWIVIIVVAAGMLADVGGIDVLGVVLIVVLLGVAPRVGVAVAQLAGSFVAWFLGPDPTAELAGRVEELATQRNEILEAVAAERRRIERNLHDGVQQQLVALGIDIGRARAKLSDDPDTARDLLDAARRTLQAAIGEMRVIGRGLHPAVLDDRGLDAALSSVVSASPIPIAVDVDLVGNLPDDTAATAFYVVNEAIANVLKHAHARSASVRVTEESVDPRVIRITVHDDGGGGAEPAAGTGLAGIRARIEGVDGAMRIDSPPGGPTTLVAVLPVRDTASSLPLPPPPPSPSGSVTT